MTNPASVQVKKTIPIVLFLFFCFWNVPVVAGTWWKISVKDVPIEAEIVQTNAEQQMGLGNRFSLPEGNGMLFIYDTPGTRVFWMKRMNFPIDIIWFRNNKAVKIEKNVPFPKRGTPDANLQRYGRGVFADMVLELPAGFAKRNQLALGDSLRILKRN